MKTNFYIPENRLDELKSFIRTQTPTARFEHNPLKEGKQYFISLTMDVQDGNKLNELHEKWYKEDNQSKKITSMNKFSFLPFFGIIWATKKQLDDLYYRAYYWTISMFLTSIIYVIVMTYIVKLF